MIKKELRKAIEQVLTDRGLKPVAVAINHGLKPVAAVTEN